jgi:hypothetical protein
MRDAEGHSLDINVFADFKSIAFLYYSVGTGGFLGSSIRLCNARVCSELLDQLGSSFISVYC